MSARIWPQPLEAVWFDLDGTLIDSAPDLYQAGVTLCVEQGVEPPDYSRFRARVSKGGKAMVDLCLPDRTEADSEHLLARFLDIYVAQPDERTLLFDGMHEVLALLAARKLPWGVVTNKSGALAEPLLQRLGLHAQAAACVYGDTLAQRKPDPAPLLHACALAGVEASRCIYVGDDERDIQAAHAAGMYALAAAWGYLDGGDPRDWGAEQVLADVDQLTRVLAAAHV